MSPDTTPVLDVRSLSLEFPVFGGSVRALNGVSLRVMPGEIVGIVGESGSGKSVTAMAALRLLPPGAYRVTEGSLRLGGDDVLAAPEPLVRQWRGRRAAMIFQEPMTALNPTQRVGEQMSGVLRVHRRISRSDALTQAQSLLRDMMIPDPAQVLRAYPFELSGGMRQRVMVAMAFSCDPDLLIADEPTTALDVTVQRQVLQLLRHHARERGTAILFITHDMAVVSQLCDRVYVMYAGTVVEQGPTRQVLRDPRHPYTRGLLEGLPEGAPPGADLAAIPGQVPDMRHPPTGCPFFDRCTYADDVCRQRPALLPLDAAAPAGNEAPDRRRLACWHPLAPSDAIEGRT
ncbi:ABC transporter ATP-binding protein [Castellaniella sp.]|uniref:ABC transporter ATP-binding protein n=1 Tax=Castellaniella sp. TaxID=1955812 RepID=UPI002AFF66F4|nr:ABC transporter ATP-binding protein [Castellaniella sp.]